MQISKGLILADPWIGHILDGSKTWEMRSSSTSHRGWFALIRKGSGCIHGVARLVDVGSPLSPAEMLRTFEKHRIPADLIASGAVAKWNTPWIIADVRRLPKPVPYTHRSGAVTWVALDAEVGQAIAAQLGDLGAEEAVVRFVPPVTSRGATPPPTTTRAAPSASAIRIEIREANLRHKHFYLRDHVHKFPDDVIGGSNRAKAAPREVILDWGGPEPARTDIDGEDKKFFRARGWVGAFYKLHDAQAGDFVLIEPIDPYRYRVRLEKAA
jgi:ASCH domain.